MFVTQVDGCRCGDNTFGLGPKEVTGFVAVHGFTLHLITLVALHGKGISRDTRQFFIKGIVAVGIDGGHLVFPVELGGSRPFARFMVVGKAYIVGMIACQGQLWRYAILVVGYKHTDVIAIGKAIVIHTRHIMLVDFCLQIQWFLHLIAVHNLIVLASHYTNRGKQSYNCGTHI